MKCRECGADKPEASGICGRCGAPEPRELSDLAAGPRATAIPPMSHRGKLGIASLVLAIAGAVGVVSACALPIVQFKGGGSLSLFSSGYANRTASVEPVVVALIGLSAARLLLRSAARPGNWWLATGMLLASGIQTLASFWPYQFGESANPRPGIAAAVGLLSGALILAAGVMGAIALVGKSVAARSTAGEQA